MDIIPRMCMLVIIASVMRPVIASDSDHHRAYVVDMQHTGRFSPIIPEWGEYAVNRNEIVPPPPGPYMSTGLLAPMPGVYRPVSGDEQNAGTEMANSPFFMPDTQWPEDKREPPRRWMPENGKYQYVSDELLEQQKQPDAGYNSNYPPVRPRHAYSRPVYHSQPVVERQPAYRGNSAFGTD